MRRRTPPAQRCRTHRCHILTTRNYLLILVERDLAI